MSSAAKVTALGVAGGTEADPAAADGALAAAVSFLVVGFGDGVRDAPATQQPAGGA